MSLLKTTPQDLPHSAKLLNQVVFLYCISGIVVQAYVMEISRTVGIVVLNILVIISFSYFLLVVLKLKERFVQTISALLGTGIFFNLLSWPLVGLIAINESSRTYDALVAILALSMISWELLVTAHIYRHAFNLRMYSAIILSLGLFFIFRIILRAVYPESP